MIGTIVNTLALLVGTSIGCFLKKGINKRFEDVLFIAMGLAALGIGWENVTNNMPKSHYPVLFIVSLALGGLCGTAWDISGHFDRLVEKTGKSNLGKGLATEILLCCIGALSIVGPVIAAVKGDYTMLFTNATLDFVTSMVFGASFGSIPINLKPQRFATLLLLSLPTATSRSMYCKFNSLKAYWHNAVTLLVTMPRP